MTERLQLYVCPLVPLEMIPLEILPETAPLFVSEMLGPQLSMMPLLSMGDVQLVLRMPFFSMTDPNGGDDDMSGHSIRCPVIFWFKSQKSRKVLMVKVWFD